MHWLSDSLRGRITQAVEQPFNVLSKEAKSLLIKLHGEVFSSSLCRTCENEQILAYIKLTRLKQNDFIMEVSTKYRFKKAFKGSTISMAAKRWIITAETLTDEQGEYLMEQGHPAIEAVKAKKATKKGE